MIRLAYKNIVIYELRDHPCNYVTFQRNLCISRLSDDSKISIQCSSLSILGIHCPFSKAKMVVTLSFAPWSSWFSRRFRRVPNSKFSDLTRTHNIPISDIRFYIARFDHYSTYLYGGGFVCVYIAQPVPISMPLYIFVPHTQGFLH